MNNYAGYKKLVSTVSQVSEDDVLPLKYKDIIMIDVVLSGLGSRCAEIVRRRFGLRGERQKLREIARVFVVSSECIRQVEIRALIKLRHPSRIENFQRLTKSWSERQKQRSETSLLDRRVEDFELSTRTLNAVRHIGVVTIGELAAKSEVEMLKTKDFGRKSLFELRCLLNHLGLDFAPDPRY